MRAAAVKGAESSAADGGLTCGVCGEAFATRNLLFTHVRSKKHHVLKEDGGGAEKKKKGKR
jgi:hypothetical protein